MKPKLAKSKKEVKTIDDYIAGYPESVAVKLRTIRAIVKKMAPEAQEVISYHMPAFKLNGILIYFAVYAHHIGLYPYPATQEAFQKELSKYKTGKGSIQFSLDKPLPVPLIRGIIKYRLKEKLAQKKK